MISNELVPPTGRTRDVSLREEHECTVRIVPHPGHTTTAPEPRFDFPKHFACILHPHVNPIVSAGGEVPPKSPQQPRQTVLSWESTSAFVTRDLQSGQNTDLVLEEPASNFPLHLMCAQRGCFMAATRSPLVLGTLAMRTAETRGSALRNANIRTKMRCSLESGRNMTWVCPWPKLR